MRLRLLSALFLIGACSLSAAQNESSVRPFSAVGVGVKLSTLGPGFQLGTPLNAHFVLRGGFNMFKYGRDFKLDGISYDNAQLQLQSAELHVDWFPFRGGFHLSPGALIYNGNQLTANSSVSGGSTFSLNSTTYLSDPALPVTGTPKLDWMRAAPMITVGWGNLVPHKKHVSVPFEIGGVYQGMPQVALNLQGNVCDANGTNCRPITSDSTVQANIQAQQSKYASKISAARFYPVISIGIGYKF